MFCQYEFKVIFCLGKPREHIVCNMANTDKTYFFYHFISFGWNKYPPAIPVFHRI